MGGSSKNEEVVTPPTAQAQPSPSPALLRQARSRPLRLTDLSGDLLIKTREDDLAVLESLGGALEDLDLLDVVRDGRGLLPLDRLGVQLPSRPRGRAEGSDLKEGVRGEKGDEPLADGTCRERSGQRKELDDDGMRRGDAPVAPRIPTLILAARERHSVSG